MLPEFKAKAYAKVNFNLKVLPKRADGFHNLESIFQTVDLYDELIVCPLEEDSSTCHCTVHCSSMLLPEKNTITLAYAAFCQIAGCKVPSISVELIKGIPSGGGLGGGSSDAAALIRVLQTMCGIQLTNSQLDYIAGKTGSDVFFFMHCDSEGKGCALVSGRGEIIKKIDSRRELFLLLIFPKVSSSTKEAYALVDELLLKESKVKYPDFKDLETVYRQSPESWNFINTFTPALTSKYEEIKYALEQLREAGALYSEMSGSGSTVFGVFTLEQQAIYSSNLLAENFNLKLVRTL